MKPAASCVVEEIHQCQLGFERSRQLVGGAEALVR